jgi:zinc protease
MLDTLLLLSAIISAGGGEMKLNFPIETYRLKNGLTVFLLEDHTLPIVAVDVNYNVGSKNEVRGKTGFAHLFEHIMFQGSKHFNDDYFKALQDIGGEVNGATNQDRTRYYEIVPSNYLERALWLESDRMGYLLDALTEERLKNQISVVINEYRQNYENRPYGMVYFELLKAIYPPNHPYSWPTIGYPEDIQSATLNDVIEFFKTYYAVNNATIAIVGDIDKEETKRLVEKYFGSFKPAKPVRFISRWSPRLTENKRIVMKDRVNLPKIYIVFPTTGVFEKYDAELDIIAKVLGENENSRLYKSLVKNKRLASDVSAFQSSSQIAGYFSISATLYPDKDINEAKEAIIKEVEGIIKEGITKSELEQAKNYFKAYFIRSLKRIGGFGGIADRLNFYYQMTGNPDMFQYDLDRYISATLKSVKEAANEYLIRPYAEIIVLPEGNLTSLNIDFDRSRMPEEKKEKDFEFQSVMKKNTSFGSELYIMPYKKLPLSKLTILIPAGAYLDKNRPGIANFTASMLTTGTKRYTAEEIQSLLDMLGSTLDSYAEPDYTVITTSFLNENAEKTIELVADILTNPSFKQEEIEILRSRLSNNLLSLQDQMSFISHASLVKQYFANHPYGHLSIGDMEFIKSVNRKEVVDFYKTYYSLEGSKIIYTGGLKESEIENLLMKYLSGWKGNSKSRVDLPGQPVPPEGLKIYFVDRPLSTQSFITFAFNGIMKTDPDYESGYITNTIFGGYFLSRLNMRLREEKGFTYGARSGFRLYKNASIWLATTSVQADSTIDTIKEIMNVINEMKRPDSLKEDEINKAKGYAVKKFPIDYETIDSIHSKVTEIAEYDLPLDSITKEYKKLKGISKEDIVKIINRYFNTDNITIIVVGDKKRVFEGLKNISKDVIELDRLGNRLR